MKIQSKKTICRILSILCILSICSHFSVNAIGISDIKQTIAEQELTVVETYAEDVSLRSEQVKHFRYGKSGYIAASYADAVHFLNSDNEWQDIDNTLKLITTSGNETSALGVNNHYYENTANSFKVRLPRALSSSTDIQIQHKEHSIAFRMLDITKTATAVPDADDKTAEQQIDLLRKAAATADTETKEELTQQAVTLLPNQVSGLSYADIQPNTTLSYTLDGQKLKESITLTAPTTQSTFSFLFTYQGLTPVVQEFGAVYFYADNAKNDEPVFIIQAPYMEDASLEDTLSMDIEVSVSPTSTGCIYTITPNKEWLNDPARVYPITIDPTVTTSTAATDIQDNGVNEFDPTENYQTVDRMYVGSNLSNGTAYESRIYIRFPRIPEIATTAFIGSALMFLDHHSQTSYQTADNLKVDVYEVGNYNWDSSSMTWNSQSGYSFTNRVTTEETDADNTYEMFDITTLVRKWYSTTAGNNGVVLKPRTKDTAKTNRTCYLSSDCDYSIKSKRPRVRVIYYPMQSLNVPLYGQERDQWCWAACAQMVAKYYGYSVTQSDIVLNTFGYLVNLPAPQVKFIKGLNYATSSSAFSYTGNASENSLFNKISNGHPVVIHRQKLLNGQNYNAHAMVVYGYIAINGIRHYLIHDPWPEVDTPWPSSNPGQNYIWTYQRISNETDSPYTIELAGFYSK